MSAASTCTSARCVRDRVQRQATTDLLDQRPCARGLGRLLCGARSPGPGRHRLAITVAHLVQLGPGYPMNQGRPFTPTTCKTGAGNTSRVL